MTERSEESGSARSESTTGLWESFSAAVESISCGTTGETFPGCVIFHSLLNWPNLKTNREDSCVDS